ncbi:MAG: hypothetical protein U0271_21485 [Polyangiaceae bacterium]
MSGLALAAAVLALGCGDDSVVGGGGAGGSVLAGGAGGDGGDGGAGGSGPSIGSVRSFGFVAVGCAFDDPLDPEQKGDYFDEVASFTNIAHVCAFQPNLDLTGKLTALASSGGRAVLDLTALLFESGVDPDTGVLVNTLRVDADQRWADFVATNSAVLDAAHVAAFYPVDEPTWTGVSTIDLESAAALTKTTHPDVPVLLIEAYPALPQLVVPTNVDWVGFDRYYIAAPDSDPSYQSDWETLKAARSRPDQKLVLILDSHYTDGHQQAGLTPDDMRAVAESATALAAREPDVVAVLGYLWPGGLEGPQQLGARELPTAALDYYESYGAAVRAAR